MINMSRPVLVKKDGRGGTVSAKISCEAKGNSQLNNALRWSPEERKMRRGVEKMGARSRRSHPFVTSE